MASDNLHSSLIFLIGMRGSGKTTVGRELARMLNLSFRDLDEELCKQENKSIARIVEEQGWPAFRNLESDCLKKVTRLSQKQAVIATGGGIVLNPGNRIFMRENGHVVWLRADENVLFARLQKDLLPDQRPSLTNLSALEEIAQIAREREPLYRACAHISIRSDQEEATICQKISSGIFGAGLLKKTLH